MDFVKYQSIENSYRDKYIELMRSEGHADGLFIVEEKIHGSNLSIWVTKDEIKVAKRSGFIIEDENFFNYKTVLDHYKDDIRSLYDWVSREDPVDVMVIYGEIYGGSYPHKDVPKQQVSKVQGDVYYRPDVDFIAFDLRINGIYLDMYKTKELLEAHNLPFVKTIFSGSLEECLKFSNTFPPSIPFQLGLSYIEGNVCEGVVIRPIKTRFMHTGQRVILKNKNEKFKERDVPKSVTPKVPPEPLSEDLTLALERMKSYVCINRLRNVLSHMGEVKNKDFGRITGLLSKDILEDLMKDDEALFYKLSEKDTKKLNKQVGASAALLLKKNFQDILEKLF
jgi:Rnl2 family RNA ligase